MEKVTAGRDILGDFAPKFAELNDDVLFGQVWGREEQLSVRDRSIVTVTALMASGVLDSSLQSHIQRAKDNGVTKAEMAEILTHAAFYTGWPKAWAAFRIAKDVYEGYFPGTRGCIRRLLRLLIQPLVSFWLIRKL